MDVSLTSELEQFVQEKVAAGRYHSASEVVRAALRLMEEKETLYQAKLDELRREIGRGIEQADRGEYSTYDEGALGNLAERIKQEGRERLAQHEKGKASRVNSGYPIRPKLLWPTFGTMLRRTA